MKGIKLKRPNSHSLMNISKSGSVNSMGPEVACLLAGHADERFLADFIRLFAGFSLSSIDVKRIFAS
jgi:hypothetical protein